MSFERGIISTADRQRGLVRYGLPAIQVVIFLGLLSLLYFRLTRRWSAT